MNKIETLNGSPGGAITKPPRSSNLELYRIICMLMIVAHHYVANSGLAAADGPILNQPLLPNSIYLSILGAWGKTGINCFLMITGYFMCTSQITFRKFLKLLLQVYFYKLLLFPVFVVAGYETVSITRLVKLALPFWGFGKGFVGCFIIFFLTIPFWNILIKNMTKQQHTWLMVLLLAVYTLFGSLPTFDVKFNYITWFGIIYLIASYIRKYPTPLFEKKQLWGIITISLVVIAIISIVGMNVLFSKFDFLLSDSNKVLAVMIAVSSFLWFKNIDIKYNKIINAFGAGTFGVLLIHANSDAMRTWLWKDTVDAIGHFDCPLGSLVLYSLGVVMAVFIICNLIDQLRIATFEKWFFAWYDKKSFVKTKEYITRINTFISK